MPSKGAPECVDCQKGPSPPPADESSMQRCNDIYDKVDKCMKANRGQVCASHAFSPCLLCLQ